MPTFPISFGTVNTQPVVSVCGPIEIGANLYCVSVDDTFSFIVMWKSTDAGLTWSIQDNANSPLWANSGGGFALATDGTSLFMAYPVDVPGTQAMGVGIFSPGTGLWTAKITTTIVSPFTSLCDDDDIFCAYDSVNGKLIIGFTSQEFGAPANGFRVGYFTFDTTAHTNTALVPIGETNNAVNENWGICGLVVSGATIQFFYVVESSTIFSPTLNTRRLVSQACVSGTLGAKITQDTITDTGFTAWNYVNYTTPAPAVTDGTTIVFGWTPTSLHPARCVVLTGDVALSSVRSETINFSAPVTGLFNFVLLRTATASYLLAVTDNGSTTSLMYGVDTGTGFTITVQSTAAYFHTTLNNMAVSAANTWNAILQGSLYFWSLFAGPIPPTPATTTGIITAQYPIVLPNPATFCVGGKLTHCLQVKCCKGVMLKTKEIVYAR